jgi:hypothetical protein
MARNSPASSRTVIALIVVTGLVASVVSAHRLDEYLQAARLAIDTARVELQLEMTPGVAVAGAIIADLDRNRDGQLSQDEQSAYAGRVLDDVKLEADGRPLRIQLLRSHFPDLKALQNGEGTITLRSTAKLPRLSAGAHRLFFRNAHRLDDSVYMANALVPENARIAIARQRRDPGQRELTIDYLVRQSQPSR